MACATLTPTTTSPAPATGARSSRLGRRGAIPAATKSSAIPPAPKAEQIAAATAANAVPAATAP